LAFRETRTADLVAQLLGSMGIAVRTHVAPPVSLLARRPRPYRHAAGAGRPADSGDQ
jgi:hypothetical protein